MSKLEYASELKIAAGWDNTAGYDLITDLTDSDSIPFTLPTPFEGMSRGITEPLLSGAIDHTDDLLLVWTFRTITIKQWYYLYSTYFNVNDSKVTVRSVSPLGTFVDYNAYMGMPINISQMLGSPDGYSTRIPGNYPANRTDMMKVSFNVQGTAS